MDFEKAKVQKAVAALFNLLKDTKKASFIDEAEKIHLQFTFKKVPNVKNKTLHLKLPHSLMRDTMDVCLFVKDVNKKKRDFDPTIHHYKELLDKHDINFVTEVIPLKSLKTEYKPYEAKRILSDRFDVFLADKCVIRLLPDFLGKAFYGRRRLPIGVNMGASNLKKELQEALDNSQCYISGRGASGMATVAHSEMKIEHVVDNVISAANHLAAGIPGGPINIKSMYMKTGLSMSVPLYFSTDDGDVVLPPKERKVVDSEPEELTTILGAKVKVSQFGDVKIIQVKRVAEDDDLDLDSLTEKKKFKSAQAKTSKKFGKNPTKSKSLAPKQKTVKSGIKQPKKKQKTKS
ncbi:ribosomal L1 domain-containing protein 1-like [Haliotis rufescens]|uniref:ribosomal L1 domain-containing protein 1-like n=1 Tax=Haliotis rufescens TaxID=6454 RepID=UPI00201EB44B|nr:ribosomal L1 domain-containing protein 1-like [Haliotis rufescens]